MHFMFKQFLCYLECGSPMLNTALEYTKFKKLYRIVHFIFKQFSGYWECGSASSEGPQHFCPKSK